MLFYVKMCEAELFPAPGTYNNECKFITGRAHLIADVETDLFHWSERRVYIS